MAYNSYFDSFELQKSSHELLWNEMSSNRFFDKQGNNKRFRFLFWIFINICFQINNMLFMLYRYKNKCFVTNKKLLTALESFIWPLMYSMVFEIKRFFKEFLKQNMKLKLDSVFLVENSFKWARQKINRYFLKIVIDKLFSFVDKVNVD